MFDKQRYCLARAFLLMCTRSLYAKTLAKRPNIVCKTIENTLSNIIFFHLVTSQNIARQKFLLPSIFACIYCWVNSPKKITKIALFSTVRKFATHKMLLFSPGTENSLGFDDEEVACDGILRRRPC